MEQNEPRRLMTGREMSKISKVNPKNTQELLLQMYKNGPFKHGFADKHLKLWKAKLMSRPEKVEEYKRNPEKRAAIVKSLISFQELQDSCFGFEPGENEYPPMNEAYEEPPTLHQWAKKLESL